MTTSHSTTLKEIYRELLHFPLLDPHVVIWLKPFHEERVARAKSSILKDLEDKERNFICHPLFLSKERFKIGFSSF